jgi:hypothetical protein
LLNPNDVNVFLYVFISVFLILAICVSAAWLIWLRVQKLKRRTRWEERNRQGAEGVLAIVED